MAKSKTKSTPAPSTSKTEQALAIFKRMHPKKSRKDILEEFVDKVGLTASSASTYYQKFMSGDDAPKRTRPTGSSGRGRLPDESSKAGIARSIFKRLADKKPRKDVLEAFVKEAKLTPAGASTYYQKMKHAA